jgi:hypothetical protein
MAFAIISPTRVEVDGKDAGLLYDYIIANPGKAAEIKAALVAWHASHVIAEQGREADLVANKEAIHAEYMAKVAEHDAEKVKLEADIAALGTKEEAQTIRKAQEREALVAQRAEIAKKLAEMDKQLEPANARTSTPESERG